MNTLAIIGHDDIYSMIDLANLADTTKAQYRKALRNYLATGANLADSQALANYASGLPKSSKAFLKSAIRLWGNDVTLKAKASATPDNVSAVQATVFRIEALNNAIQVEAQKGVKAHSWLTQSEVKRLVGLCDDSLIGKRDRVVLSLLLGAGLRREELINLRFDMVMMQGNRAVLNVRGKGAKDRIIPLSEKLHSIVQDWQQIALDGLVVRSISHRRELSESLSSVQVYRIVNEYGQLIGKPDLAPHDCRRTFAQLAFEAGIPVTQISLLLGHSDLATTQRYLNLELNLETTASDFIPL